MDQLITLLTNLFNLTKVASVTLPGIALAGALAIFFLPPHPVDVIRIPAVVAVAASTLPDEQKPCADLNVGIAKAGRVTGNCHAANLPVQRKTAACRLTPIPLNLFDEESTFKFPSFCALIRDAPATSPQSDLDLRNRLKDWCKSQKSTRGELPNSENLCEQADEAARAQMRGKSSEQLDHALRQDMETLCLQWRWPWNGDSGTLAVTNLFKEPGQQRDVPNDVTANDIENAASQIFDFATTRGRHPWEPKVIKQFVLERARDRLTTCDELERAWQGQEAADNEQLKADIANLDKQRGDMQDAYIASLKTNDRSIAKNFQLKLTGILELTNEYRERFGVNLIGLNERARRLEDVKQEQDTLTARLAEPDRLRPVKDFDVYTQGLVNHVVGLILLTIALSLILVAFDRTVLGNLFETLFPGW